MNIQDPVLNKKNSNIQDPVLNKKNKFRFETLEDNEEMTGGISLLEKNAIQTGGTTANSSSSAYSDLVIPYSVAYEKKPIPKIPRSPYNPIDKIQNQPKVIGGELFDKLFFELGSQDTKSKK